MARRATSAAPVAFQDWYQRPTAAPPFVQTWTKAATSPLAGPMLFIEPCPLPCEEHP